MSLGGKLMKTKSEFFRFVKTSEKTPNGVYAVVSKYDNTLVGKIKWYWRWKQYGFFPEFPTVLSQDGMKDISTYMDKLTWELKEKEMNKNRCGYKCPICGVRCGGYKGHGSPHQCLEGCPMNRKVQHDFDK